MAPDGENARRISQRAHEIASREALRLFREHCEEKWTELLDDAYDHLGHPRRNPGRPHE